MHDPKSPPPLSWQARTEKHAYCVPLNAPKVHPLASPQVAPALVHTPFACPGPSGPHAATLSGIPVLGSARTAEPMSLVSLMMPMRAPARAAPAASTAWKYERPP